VAGLGSWCAESAASQGRSRCSERPACLMHKLSTLNPRLGCAESAASHSPIHAESTAVAGVVHAESAALPIRDLESTPYRGHRSRPLLSWVEGDATDLVRTVEHNHARGRRKSQRAIPPRPPMQRDAA